MGKSPETPFVIYYGLTIVHSSTLGMNLTFDKSQTSQDICKIKFTSLKLSKQYTT